MLAVLTRALERGDLQDVALQQAEVDAVAEQLATWSSLPQSGGGWAPGGGGGANGPMVRNSAPIIPSGVQLNSPIVPPGRQTRTSSSATSWWWGANIAPIEDMTTSNDPSSNGRLSASASTHSRVSPSASARVRPASRSSGVRSLAVTFAPACAAGIDALPVPAATSRTSIPGPIPQASTRRGPSGSRNVSTIAG